MEPGDIPLPLTRGQLDIWLSQEAGLVGTGWQLGLLGRIAGRVNPAHLQEAIRRAAREAEPGRASFFLVAGQVVQRAVDYPDIELDFYDLTGFENPAQAVQETAAAIQRIPMPLSGPLFKFTLFQTSPDESYLFACCHHIAMDGVGMVLVSRRIAAIYSALVSGDPVPAAYFGSLQELIDCESAYEASPDYLADRDYWTANLPAAGGPQNWPSASDNAVDGFTPSPAVAFDTSVVGYAKSLSKALRIRRYAVFTAACALLVRSWSGGGSEVVLDFPVSRRVTPESKTLPGMLSGVLPLVVQTQPGSTVAEFCQHVDARIRELLHHQRFPVRALESTGFGALRQVSSRVAVNFIPSRLTLEFGPLEVTAAFTNNGPVGHFGLFFIGSGDDLSLSTAGTGEPFASTGAESLITRLARVLRSMAADPEQRLSGIDVLDECEHGRLDGWGNRAVLRRPMVESGSIPEVFAARVAGAPEAVAVRFEGRSWSYRELDEASNRLAHWLVERGAGPGQYVALLLPRSAQAIVAMLAVLKCGAAYVPMDAAHPDARISFMLADAAPIAVITDAELRPRLEGHDLPIIDIHDPAIEAAPVSGLALPGADEIAYLIYTSGTTGVPKGVAISHRNLTQLLESLQSGMPAGSVWAQWHSLAFDASVEEIWAALLGGGCLVIVSEEVVVSPGDLRALLVAEKVSVLSQTPSALGVLSAEGLESVALVVAGEVCPAEVVDRWAPGRVMVNA